MYEIRKTGEMVDSFFKAVELAKRIDSEVYQVGNGLRRWSPPPPVSRKRLRNYRERLAAHDAQERQMKGAKS